MQCLPFPEYAHPQGSLNVANYLAEDLIKPDLGPKSYIATGRYTQSYTLININVFITTAAPNLNWHSPLQSL